MYRNAEDQDGLPSLPERSERSFPSLRPTVGGPLQLSCVITSFNYAAFIGRAIQSVLDQADERCEIIVVDNASKDESWDIIQSFGIEKSIKLERNYGHLGACQRGFKYASAPFVLFLDSDDELAPGALSRILHLLEPDVVKVQFPLTPIDPNNNVIGPPFPQLSDSRERHALIKRVENFGFYETPPTSGNVLCRRLCELLADVDYETSGDGICLLAAPFFGDVISLSTPLGFYRVHGRNVSQAGGRPTVEMIDEATRRFHERLRHLSRITSARQQPLYLLPNDQYLYPLTQNLLRQLLLNEGPRLGGVAKLIFRLARADLSLSKKAVEGVYFSMLWALPRPMAMALLDYRSRRSSRSVVGFFKSLFGRAGRASTSGGAVAGA